MGLDWRDGRVVGKRRVLFEVIAQYAARREIELVAVVVVVLVRKRAEAHERLDVLVVVGVIVRVAGSVERGS